MGDIYDFNSGAKIPDNTGLPNEAMIRFLEDRLKEAKRGELHTFALRMEGLQSGETTWAVLGYGDDLSRLISGMEVVKARIIHDMPMSIIPD